MFLFCTIIIWSNTTLTRIQLYKTSVFTVYLMELETVRMFDQFFVYLFDIHLIHALVICIAVFLFLLILFGVQYLLGIPPKARQIEIDLAAALVTKRDYYKRPFLISVKPIKNSDLTDYTLYARWLSVEDFIKEESKVLSALASKRTESYRFKGKRQRMLVIRAGINETSPDRGTLHDDEL